jgi:iron uptake system component EfeO
MIVRIIPLVSITALTALSLSGCVLNTPVGAGNINVTSSATECLLSSSEAASGTVQFDVTNTGEKATEFYILAEDGLRVVGEVENVGPGLSRSLLINAVPGTYYTVCKPGMTGAGIGNTVFTVTDSGTSTALSTDVQAHVDTASENYSAYVRNEIDQLVTGTSAFASAYVAGDFDTARALYAPTRTHWERVETVAESFGDLDPKLDLREADLEEGQQWTGWHAIEKDLWPQNAEPGFAAYSPSKREQLAHLLVTDTATLQSNVQNLTFDLPQLTNGAIGLLDEVATGKVTGEEEIWSHTDLWDFQASIDGASVLYGGVRSILFQKNPALANQLDSEFAELQRLLDAHRVGEGFVLYNQLSAAQIKALADQVNALAEPLNKLTAALVK